MEWRVHRGHTTNEGDQTGQPHFTVPICFVLGKIRSSHQKEVDEGCWKMLRASRKAQAISHLFFYDLILFAEISSMQMEVIKRCLDEFAEALV